MSRARRSRREDGFTIIEVMIAALVIVVALGVVMTTQVNFRNLSSTDETKAAATKIAQQELERLRSLGWGALLMDGTPTASGTSNTSDPLSSVYLSGTQYRPSATDALQSLAIGDLPDPSNCSLTNPDGSQVANQPCYLVSSTPSTWSDDKISGKIYRFVTYGDDTACGTSCPSSQDYKRITVAVTVTAPASAIKNPVIISTEITNPADQQTQTVTTTATTPVVSNGYLTYYPYDTAASLGARVAPSANHTKVDTHAKPYLMDQDPPPDPNAGLDPDPAVPTYDYSSDIASAATFGRTIRKDPNCDKYDTDHVMYWVSPILTSATKLTGNASADLYVQTADGLSHPGRVCVAVFDVPGTLKADGSLNGPDTLIGSIQSAELNPMYTTYDEMQFNFDFLPAGTAYYTVATGRRIGVKLTVADHLASNTAIASNDLNFMYDHPDYPSSFGFETTP